MICSVDGCSLPPVRRGWCKSHYNRWLKYGEATGGPPLKRRSKDLLKYLFDVVVHYQGKDCLTWPFPLAGNGYGQVTYQGKNRVVSRIVCEVVRGNPPSPKHQAAHSCGRGNKGCVNPMHLSWKTPGENLADKIIHGTHPIGERNGIAKLTEADVLQIRRLYPQFSQSQIAEMFGCSQTNVSLIILRKHWSHVSAEAA